MSLGILATTIQQSITARYTQLLPLQVRNYAARKGTRERKRKKKVKVEVKKIGFIPHNLRFKRTEVVTLEKLQKQDSAKSPAIDDVWLGKYHKLRIYPFDEAVQGHRETHDPTVYNLPNSFINAFIELNMKTDKVKTVEAFTRTVALPFPFAHGEPVKILALSKSSEFREMADKAGAVMTGGPELILKIQKGELSADEYSNVVAHPDIMADLSVIRGLLKRKFPNPRTGTLGMDLGLLVRKIISGLKYKAQPDPRLPVYGSITVPIGLLPMKTNELEENLKTIVTDIESVRPKRDGEFITRITLRSPPSPESLIVNHNNYIVSQESDAYGSDDEEDAVLSNTV